ncbi:MAG: hypothetical protein ACE37F_00785 [Nannocystaceae bacterium]|nr:hypothetical protein [bacterium]
MSTQGPELWMLGAAAVGLVALSSRGRRPSAPRGTRPMPPDTDHGHHGGDSPSSRPRPPVPDGDVEFGAYVFPPPRAPKDWDRMRTLAAVAERETGMHNLYSFLLAAARTESGGRSSAMNTATDAKPAFSLFCRDQNFARRYAQNPWRPSTCTPQAAGAARWAYSGGWFQIMPATALATADKRAHTHDPARVFDPPFAVAYAVDLAARIARNYGARTWGDVRAGWALPRWARPEAVSEGKTRNQERFRRSAAALRSFGVAPNIDQLPVKTAGYPGFTHVLHALLATEGRTRLSDAPPLLGSGEPEVPLAGRFITAPWRFPDLFVDPLPETPATAAA